MKKILKPIIILLVFIITIFVLYNFTPIFEPIKENIITSPYVSDNGWLKVDKTQIKNKYNHNFTLKGLSSHGIQWYSDLLTYDNLKTLKETWNINVFRVAMYTGENGYISNKESIKQKVIEIANNVIDLDMYVIIDWHTLLDNDPNTYKNEALSFFDEISRLYANTPNIIYEICNEPNGNSVTWDNNIKPYAEVVIPVIRQNSPNSLIIVGTPNWCKELEPVYKNPLEFSNILYSCHFYSGTHKQELRDEITKALNNNLPIIVSEFGTTDASGDGNVDSEETKKWIDFLNSQKISYINWSFSNKNESSAAISDSLEDNSTFNNHLTTSGSLIKTLFK